MNSTGLGILILLAIIVAIICYRVFKPYFIKYDTTITINGGLGSGKTLHAVKIAIVLIRKVRFIKWKLYNKIRQPIEHFFKSKVNKHRIKLNAKHRNDPKWKLKPLLKIHAKRKKPLLYSNIPIHFKKSLFKREREWAIKLEAPHILLLKQIREYSIVVIDELPQFVNQFNWKEELIQNNVNEFITFFRHYVGGYFICTSQASDDIVVQIRRKLNQAIWCFDFKKHLFGLFYTVRMCDIMLSDQIGTISTTFIEDNTKVHFGLFPARNTYDTRCYKPRYNNAYIKEDSDTVETLNKAKNVKWTTLQTMQVLRLMEYKSPLDEIRTEQEKKEMWQKGEQIWKN